MLMSKDTQGEVMSDQDVLRLSAEIVAAYVSHNTLQAGSITDVVRQVHGALSGLSRPQPIAPPPKQKPAAPVSRSVQADFIVCLEDGAKLKMLKRYLRSRYDMSPEEYRRKWGLPADYPMVAPNYAARRSDFAKKIGLGRGVRRKRSAKG
jgi:predicted transcriptional regulator